jgi:hypothetical protein
MQRKRKPRREFARRTFFFHSIICVARGHF